MQTEQMAGVFQSTAAIRLCTATHHPEGEEIEFGIVSFDQLLKATSFTIIIKSHMRESQTIWKFETLHGGG